MWFIKIGFVAILFSTVFSGPSNADSLTFYMLNKTGTSVGVEFYGEGTNRAWPGDNKMFTIYFGDDIVWEDGLPVEKPIVFRLNCNTGEKICMGAWDIELGSGDDWGVGRGGKKGCTGCCAICGGEPARKTLD